MPLFNPTSPGRPLSPAIPGRPVDLAAYDWQAITQAVANGQPPPPLPPTPTQYGAAPQYIMVRNDNDDPDHWLWSGSAFAIKECLTPHYHYADHSPGGTTPPDSFQHDWLAGFSGKQQVDPDFPGLWAVAVDSIKPGEWGRAVYSGLAWVIWYQLEEDWPNHQHARRLDYVSGWGASQLGYTVRGYPGRGFILWAPDYHQAGYVLGLAYLGTAPTPWTELSTYSTTPQNLAAPVSGISDNVLEPFLNLVTDTTAGAWTRHAWHVVKCNRVGVWRLDFQADISPAALENPWPNNSPAKQLAHSYRLWVEQSPSPTFAADNIVAGAGLADRFTHYPATGFSAEAFTFAKVTTAPAYFRLRLTAGLYGSPTSYGSVARCQFAARYSGAAADANQQAAWSDF